MNWTFFVLSLLTSSISSFNFELDKVVIHQPSYSSQTNFGYSVAGYKVDNESWLLVGAPQTLRERGINRIKSREGAIYRCRINVPNSCFMLPFDKKDDWNEVRDQYGVYYSENKNEQLLGTTLKVEDDVIMACAPNYRYVTRIFRQDEFRYEPTGMCYVLKDKMRKIEEYSPCKNAMWGHHRQGYCQAGFSAAISKNDSSLFISAPGAWYWQGMMFSVNLNNKHVKSKYPERSGQGKFDDSYRGYALDLGYFDSDSYQDIIVSSPRANDCRGVVEIFSSSLQLLYTFNGYQV
jgi:integrin alpha 8